MTVDLRFKCDHCGVNIQERDRNLGVSLVYKKALNPDREWELQVGFVGTFYEPDSNYKTVNICGDCRKMIINPSPSNPKNEKEKSSSTS